jgi:hypothetical protein
MRNSCKGGKGRPRTLSRGEAPSQRDDGSEAERASALKTELPEKRNSEGGPSEFNPAVAGGGSCTSFSGGNAFGNAGRVVLVMKYREIIILREFY